MIDDADKVIICRETPDLSFGIGNTLNYKNWDLSFFFYGEIGRELYNKYSFAVFEGRTFPL